MNTPTELNLILDAVEESILLLEVESDTVFRFSYVNSLAPKIFQKTKEAFIGKTIDEVLGDNPSLRDISIQRCHMVVTTKQKLQNEDTFTLPIGTIIIESLLIPIVGDQGNITHILSVNKNVTDKKQAENALKESEKRFKTLTTNAPVGIFLTDTDGNCLFANEQWCLYAGLPPEKAKGVGWIQGIHPDDRETLFAKWKESVTKREKFSAEYRFQDKNGISRLVSGVAAPIFNEDGSINGYVGTIIDITEQKKAQELTLRRTEELELLNKGMIGRELRMAELKEQVEQLKAQLASKDIV